MEELLNEQSGEIRSFKHGDVVEGTVVRIDKDEILVDIGAKSEGVVSNRELYGRNAESQPALEIDRAPSALLAERYRVTPTRARLLPAGAALMLAFMERYELEAVETSEASLREGAVLAHRHAGSDWRPRLTELTAGWPDPDVKALSAG
jgi:exopolyphosphatase/pppGpp-phosphohydrolase